VAVSFAKAGAKGVVIVDILDDATLAAGAQKVESYGATVRSHRLQYSKYIIIIIAIKCLAIQADVTKEEDIESAIAQTVSKFGRIDYAAYVILLLTLISSADHDVVTLQVLVAKAVP
jgi:NAD(P)-dependent dehydrogenase (short-subunit alcohol dehydrogenase family)